MTRPRLPYWFFAALLLYALIRCWRWYGNIPPIINNYAADLLCMPVVLSLCLAGARLVKRDPQLRVGIGEILIVTLQFIILFEVVLPAYRPCYRGDWMDVLMYLAGSAFFAAWHWSEVRTAEPGRKTLSS